MPILPISAELSRLIDRAGSLGAFDLFKRLDDMASSLVNTPVTTTNYPPTNIVQETDDRWRVDLAVAGFKRDEITINIENETLTVTGEKMINNINTPETEIVIKNGIAMRQFKSTFQLPERVDSFSAKLADGILTIVITRPTESKVAPRRVIQIE